MKRRFPSSSRDGLGLRRVDDRRRKVESRKPKLKLVEILCPRCHVGRIDYERCDRCGYRPSRAQEEQERVNRLVRNGLIGLIMLLVVVWLVRVL